MKLGLLLPQLRPSLEPSVEVARRAEERGVSGLFAFDHLWAPDKPTVPCLAPFPLLAAIAVRTTRIELGTLIARVDTADIEVVINRFRTLQELSGGRVIAGLGTGDRVTDEEDQAAGIPHRSYEARLELLEEVASRLVGESIAVWLAGSSPQVEAIAQRQGVLVHLWEPTAERLDAQKAKFTTGAVLDGSADEVTVHLNRSLRTGAKWAVCGYRGGLDRAGALDTLVRANARVG